MLPVCTDFGFFHWLFYLTGAVIWGFVAACLVLVICLASYHALGATIFTFRVLGILKRAKETYPLKKKLGYWWDCFLGDYGHGSFIHQKTYERAYWPWPWYRKNQDRYAGVEDLEALDD